MMLFTKLCRSKLLLLLLLVACSIGFEAAAASGEDDPLDLAAFDGQWERIDNPRDEEGRIASIGRAVDDMSWLMRGMARSMLRRRARPPSEIQFVWDGSGLSHRDGGREAGDPRPVQLDGEPWRIEHGKNGAVSLSWHSAPDGMLERWEQHQAHGNNVYRVDRDGDVLVVEHTIQITALSNIKPIIYRSHFARRGAPPHVSAAQAPERAQSHPTP